MLTSWSSPVLEEFLLLRLCRRGTAGHHHLCRLYWASTCSGYLQTLSVPTYTSWELKDMIRPFLGKGRPPRHPVLSEMKLSEPSLWTRPETTHTPDDAITDPV
jgi:hypothetical protein